MSDPYLLLVDDNEDDVYLSLRALRKDRFGIPIRSVSNGTRALEILDGDSSLPLALLVNNRQSLMSGPELLQRVREHPRGRKLPIILLAGSADERDQVCSADPGSRSGADAWLIKPLQSRALQAVLLGCTATGYPHSP